MTIIELKNRNTLYGLISRIMIQEADEPFLRSIEENPEILDLLPNFKGWNKRIELKKSLLIEENLSVDYANLFLLHLVPYETFYVREDQMIESGGENPVAILYDALDFRAQLERARVVSPDHIGVESEFMYMLSSATIKAFEADDNEGVTELFQVQRGFLRDHLLKWAPMFLINMKREASTPFYYDGAELALEFLLSDYEYISETLCK